MLREEQIGRKGRLHFSEAVITIEAEGVKDATSVLEAPGYRVIWRGISSEKAES